MDHIGLRYYLRHPLWPFDQVRAVIYIGLAPEDEVRLRALFSAYGIPLYVVPQPASLRFGEASVFIPGRAGRRLQGAEDPAAVSSEPAPRLATLLERAVPMTQQMAEAVNALLLREAVTPDAFMPVQVDTLQVPVSNY